ncbi:MAG: hypothetical protein Q9217_006140 [Psora testacea]
MKRIATSASSPVRCIYDHSNANLRSSAALQCLHNSATRSATPLPLTATGPPPAAPLPAASQDGERVDRRRRQAELLKRGQDLRINQMKPGSAMQKRFWKAVSVQTDEQGTHTISLDTRPVRNPATKTPLHIPPSKPHLATAIALEWDLLTSAQQALRSHLIPLTSLASRAHSLALEDGQTTGPEGFAAAGSKGEGTRYEIVNTLLRYLDTDTLLCWAPPMTKAEGENVNAEGERLRDVQIRTARPILAYLTQRVWPGVELRETLDDGSILPRSQPAATRAVIKGWMAGLPAWELVGLERAVLAGKSLCVGARFLCEWSEELRFLNDGVGKEGDQKGEGSFGIEEAAKACSLEVSWQTGRWGEVEDSHDVDREDLRRQLGSVVLLVSGTKGAE